MFIERLNEKFNTNEPIFTEEILELFSDYSRAQVFRYINKAKIEGLIVQFDKGVYYLPTNTFFGISVISVDSVIEKKYLRNNHDVFGVYSGLRLLNAFSVTTQFPAVIEIVSNNESSKCRDITIQGRHFILRRPRFKIDKNNVAIYTILQLFSDFGKETILDELSKRILIDYINENGIDLKQLLEFSLKFPTKTTYNLLRSGLINDVTRGKKSFC